MRAIELWIAFLIAVVLLGYTIKVANAGDDILYSKIKTIEPEDVNGQYCFTKIIIKQKGDTIVKEEILECADGRVAFDGPTYWQLFSKFYYAGVNVPKYCRKYNRPKHPYKTYGKVCLDEKGNWK